MEVVTIRKGVIDTYGRRKRFRQLTSWIVGISGTIIAVVALLSYYGLQVGSFVISMDYDRTVRSIYLSTNEDCSDPQTQITAAPLKKALQTQYNSIPKNIDEGMGSKNGYSSEYTESQVYLAYTFYLFNAGTESVDYTMEFSITNVKRGLDEIVRFMIIENSTLETIYAKPKDDGTPEPLAGGDGQAIGTTVPFASDTIICAKEYQDFDRGDRTRYTIVFWLDGWDEDDDENMMGGSMKLSLKFKISG